MILNHDGSAWDLGALTPPPPFTGTNGVYLLGDKCPVLSTGNDVFLYILGRAPNIGEQFTRLNATDQTYVTSTYRAGGTWDILPSMHVGDAAFFNIGPVAAPVVRPRLNISVYSQTLLRITWGTNFTGYTLQYATNMPASAWVPATNAAVVVGDSFAVTVQSGTPRFFRLQH